MPAFYLRTPGAKVLPKALWTVGPRGKVAAGPVLLHVGTASVEPTEGHTYDPTDGATTDPYPAVPACASATVPERANAVASTIVLGFMAVSFLAVFSCRFVGDLRCETITHRHWAMAIDTLVQNGRRLEHHHPRSWHFGAGLRGSSFVIGPFPFPITGKCASQHGNASLVHARVYKSEIEGFPGPPRKSPRRS
jgi:hypothetical protein